MRDSEASGGPQRAAAVRRMFGAIAPRYDLLNHLLSLNIDRRWRRRTADLLLDGLPVRARVLDLCAGTFDLALELARRERFHGDVVAADFALPMLRQGLPKLAGARVAPACADALELPFADAVFDGVMVAFGIRNLADVDAGLREIARVLRPGGRLAVLEFSLPRRRLLRGPYLFYFRHVLPRVGRLVSGHDEAYSYLPESVQAFGPPHELARRVEAAGFRRARWSSLSGGIAAVHVAARMPATSQNS